MPLPNVREMFVPDPDCIMFECDLKGADAQVVAWEANDNALKRAFRMGYDVHTQNACDLFDNEDLRSIAYFGDDMARHKAFVKKVKETSSLNRLRQFAKVGVHATNYGCKEKTLAEHLRITTPAAQAFQARWFQAHPGIAEWHARTMNCLETDRTVRNMFGYQRRYFDRIEEILPEALAWVPQSTVAICINKGWVQLAKSGIPAQILLQVHDSIVGQFPACELRRNPDLPNQIRRAMQVTIPYSDPLQIGLSIKCSPVSWGACKEWNSEADTELLLAA